MRATAEPVDGNKVKLSVEIDETEVDRVLDEAVRTLSRQARIPGFRPGKVPRRVLEARMGGAVALRAEALREALPDFYAQAVVDAELDVINTPEIDITAGEESGPVAFDALVEVRPLVGVPGYGGLLVTVPSPVVSDEDVDAQVDRLREQEGELVEVGRPARDKDNVTIDVHGNDQSGEEVVGVDDFVYEVGSGTVVAELDDHLRGSKPGDVLAFSATPAGGTAVDFKILVKDVKEKHLPEATDAWAEENSEFATVAELRADLHQRIGRVKIVQTQMALQESALGALVELVDEDEVPEVLVDQEVEQRVHDLGHRLEQQRINLDQFLAATGRSGEDLLAELRVDALRAVKADLALRAVAEAEELTVTPEELDVEIEAMAERMEVDPAQLRAQLDRAGRMAAVRSEQRKAKALTWLLDHVELVDEDGNPVSRDALRATPEAGEDESGGTTPEVVDEAEQVSASDEDAPGLAAGDGGDETDAEGDDEHEGES